MILRSLIILSMVMLAVLLGSVAWLLLAPAAPTAVATPAAVEIAPPPPRVQILVAARPLAAGTLLKDEDFLLRDVPATAADDTLLHAPMGAAGELRTEVRGALLRNYLDPGTPARREDLIRPRDRGFLASVLRPGWRAISVGVDVVTGTAGLIWPGDHVDLILTQELAAGDAPLARRVIGETVLSDVRVIAVDQQFTQGTAGEGAPSRIARTVTLEVLPEQAERVVVAGRLGRIALSVRSAEMFQLEASSPQRALFGADVSHALARSAISQGARMQVIQGDERAEVTFR